MVTVLMWGVVRRTHDDGKEFVLSDEMSPSYDVATMREDCNAKSLPQWHAANPVVRVARFKVTEEAA